MRRFLFAFAALLTALVATLVAPTAAQAVGGYGAVILWPGTSYGGGSGVVCTSTKYDAWTDCGLRGTSFDNTTTSIEIGGSKAYYGCEARLYDADNVAGTYFEITAGTTHVRDLYNYRGFPNLASKKFSNGTVANNRISSLSIYCADIR